MKKCILLSLLLFPLYITAQQLEPVDSLTAETLLKKHLKAVFFQRSIHVKHEHCGNRKLLYPGDHVIRLVTPGMGKWYRHPDYTIRQLQLDTPFLDFNKLYKLEIPDSTPRNDSIAGYNIYRDRLFTYESWKILTDCQWLAQDNKNTENIEYLNNCTFGGGVVKLKYRQPYYSPYWCEPEHSSKKYPILSPQTDSELVDFLKSELMKNIYSYRLIKSGILDSLINEQFYIRDNVDVFPLLDKLLPDMDNDLFMESKRLEWGSVYNEYYKVKMWRFFYPGADYLTNSKGETFRDTTWSKYIQLKPQNYVVGYDYERELVFFVSGDDFFKTRKYDKIRFTKESERYPRNERDSLRAADIRLFYAQDIMKAYNNHYPGISNKDGIRETGEDENYWYFEQTRNSMYTGISDMWQTKTLFDNKNCVTHYFREEMCDYKIRMNKQNYEDVEIYEKANCKSWNSAFIMEFKNPQFDLGNKFLKKKEENPEN
jgi:hypothetical protein